MHSSTMDYKLSCRLMSITAWVAHDLNRTSWWLPSGLSRPFRDGRRHIRQKRGLAASRRLHCRHASEQAATEQPYLHRSRHRCCSKHSHTSAWGCHTEQSHLDAHVHMLGQTLAALLRGWLTLWLCSCALLLMAHCRGHPDALGRPQREGAAHGQRDLARAQREIKPACRITASSALTA